MILFWQNVWALVLDSAVYLLIGFFIAGLMKAFISRELIHRYLGKRSFGSVLFAAFIGVPLPVCSCGILPLVQDIRRRGASRGAAVSFLASTPQTGVDSIALTYGLMGLGMAVLRPVYAFFTGIFCGMLENVIESREEKQSIEPVEPVVSSCCSGTKPVEPVVSSCCSGTKPVEPVVSSCCSGAKPVEPVVSSCCSGTKPVEPVISSCCSGAKPAEPVISSCCATSATSQREGWLRRIISGIKYAFDDLLRDISPALLFGFLLGGVISSFLSEKMVTEYFGGGIMGMLGMVMIAIPMYVCSTSSTPAGVALLLKGMSPGTVLIFLVAGPVVNIASFTVLSKILGRRIVVRYALMLVVLTLSFGLLTDFLFTHIGLFKTGVFQLDLKSSAICCTGHEASWIRVLSAVILLGLSFYHTGNILRKKLVK